MDRIIVRGAREHNLKNITVEFPRNQFVVLTGVSGSGKSSFAFDTLYAEGQRRYVESLSAYARQFLGQLEKPLYESIEGLSPAISIEQKTVSHNPRSTVGTVTEISDYMRVLFARMGIPHCPECGREVSSQSTQQMLDRILRIPAGTRLLITAPLIRNRKGVHADLFPELRRKGYVRVMINGKIHSLDETLTLNARKKNDVYLVVDRIICGEGKDTSGRLMDSVETALSEGNGIISVINADTNEETLMSEHSACAWCGISMPDLTPQLFSFNNPAGMCEECSGLGYEMKADPLLVIPRKALSIKDGAVAPWGIPSGQGNYLVKALSRALDFNIGAPWKSLSEDTQDAILYGAGDKKISISWSSSNSSGTWETKWEGVIPRLERRHHSTSSQAARKHYEKFFNRTYCSACEGTRLRREARAVTVGDKGIHELNSMTVKELHSFFINLELDDWRLKVAGELLKEIRGRLEFLVNVGLHYLTLDRTAPSLSGGEAQRIRLASQIGSGLTGVLYVLDEPTIGLHQRDNLKLLSTLDELRDLGNTVLVVEHDHETILHADHIIDFGPGAGIHGGNIVAAGTPLDIIASPDSLTGDYLSGRKFIHRTVPVVSGMGKNSIILRKASLHNLKDVTLEIPLGRLICVTGVSGSGKSSLISQTLYPALSAVTGGSSKERPGPYGSLEGEKKIDKVINISQDPIGRTPRSNPATYTKVFGHIRELFAQTSQAKIRGYKPGRFSFNVKGGRCEECRGAGVIKIEMHFLADVFVECKECRGHRFNRETLKITYRRLNISEVLDLTVSEALNHFERVPQVYRILKVLDDVGLGYLQLGQQATTLSGGEAQRIKLARELARPGSSHTVYILDEPTTGLHFHDVKKLLMVLGRLVKTGNTVIVIEHNLDVIKNAGWIIDLGPDGGDAGGSIIATGTPEELAANKDSHTGHFLKTILEAEA
ncbi:MAG: excinuclease ABC subunit UvrA [Candidatus Aegiribacteria sp.]|nr:excinuclease ABC subunit UvrA [Candidatus Aegiribacteria sp.]